MAPGAADPRVVPAMYLTADVPPVGGVIKARPEDFLVEEQPLYQPAGEGEHLYLFIEKRDLSTFGMVGIVARHFGVKERDVGYAGLKDRAAITRQLVSVHTPGKGPRDFPALEHDKVKVLWVDRHANKLRQGHLAGNRFIVRIRGVNPSDAVRAHKVVARLEKTGVPNRFGEQRFGYLGVNHLVGAALVHDDPGEVLRLVLGPLARAPEHQRGARESFSRGEYAKALEATARSALLERRLLVALERGDRPAQAIRRIDPMQRRFFISALQSAVFNGVLERRLAAGSFDRLGPGDVAFKHDNRACFVVDESALADPTLAPRLASMQISPSGPMWGPEMLRATGEVDALERECLAERGVTLERLAAYAERTGDSVNGARRPLRVPITDADVEGGRDEHGPYIRVAFDLPRGSFATVVLREIMKPELVPGAAMGSDEESGE
jgi:tRNA pseudouridine13 synthase